MLLANFSVYRMRFNGGSPLGVMLGRRNACDCPVMLAAHFGAGAAYPQGYNDLAVALIPPIKNSARMSARFRLDLDLTHQLTGIGWVTASHGVEMTLTPAGNVLANATASMVIALGLAAPVRGIGRLSVNMDLIERPSARDISYEIQPVMTAAVASITAAITANNTTLGTTIKTAIENQPAQRPTRSRR